MQFDHAEIRGAIACHSAHDRSPREVSDQVITFTSGALQDGLSRAERHFSVEGETIERLSEGVFRDAAKRFSTTHFFTAYASVGPVADRLVELRPRLASQGIELVQIRRPEDTAIWPRSTKGFYGLKERIPELIRDLGIGTPALLQDDLFGKSNQRAAAYR